MNIYEPCLFRKFAVREEPAVGGGTISPGGVVGCVLLEFDDQLMGGPGWHIMLSWRNYSKGSNLENGTGCCRTGRRNSEDANSHGGLIGASRLT